MKFTNLFIFTFLFLTTNFDTSIYENKNDTIIGGWRISKVKLIGIEQTWCHTPEILFYTTGYGKFISDEKISNFSWVINNKKIIFKFKTDIDKQNFMSENFEFNYDFTENNSKERCRLMFDNNQSWYQLSRYKE